MKKIIISVIALLVIFSTTVTTVFAKGVPEESDYYAEQMQKLNDMRTRTIKVHIDHGGGYIAKTSKFYARKAIGVNEDGSFKLGAWECVDAHNHECMGDDKFELTGDYVMFAYSLDIDWGTDFPYSGVFWDNVNEPVNDIKIIHCGLCRNVSLSIDVNGKTIFYDGDCSSHSEWKP